MEKLLPETLRMFSDHLSPESVINLSATCGKFRLFYSSLLPYIKQLKHPEIFIQLRGLVHMLENINQLRQHFPLCNSILRGYLSNLPAWEYTNHRIIIEMILFRTTKDKRHAFKIIHLIHAKGVHPLIISFITEKLKKICGLSHSLETVLQEIQSILNVKHPNYEAIYCKYGFSNWILYEYIALFYSDLDMQHRETAICTMRDDLARRGPELNIQGIKFQIANLKLVALSHHDKDFKSSFSKSLITPFTATSCHDNRKYMDEDIVDLILRMIGPEYFSAMINAGKTGLFFPMRLLSHLFNSLQYMNAKYLLLENWEYFICGIVDENGLNEISLQTIMIYINGNPFLLSRLLHYFQQRIFISKHIFEMLGCYDVVLRIEKVESRNELWTVIYDKILEEFNAGRQNTLWIYKVKLTNDQRQLLEEKLIEIFSDYVEPYSYAIHGLQKHDWYEIMKNTTCDEHKEIAILHLERHRRKKAKLEKRNSFAQRQGILEEKIPSAECLIHDIIHHDSLANEEKMKHRNSDAIFCEKIIQFRQYYWCMQDRFLEDCYPLILRKIEQYLDDKMSNYEYFSNHGLSLLLQLLQLCPNKSHKIIVDILDRGSLNAVSKIIDVLNIIYQKIPDQYIRRYVDMLFNYLLKGPMMDSHFDWDQGKFIEFLLHVCEYLTSEQQILLSAINTQLRPLICFMSDVSTMIQPNPDRALNVTN